MSIPKDVKCWCCGVCDSAWGWYKCPNRAKVERDGKFYCGAHDPERIRAKNDALSAKFEADWKAKIEREKAAEEKQAALERDAARYRWLRHGNHDEYILEFSFYARCGTDDVWVLRDEFLDAAIDAAISETTKEKT